jgi:hypothetical protein
MTTEDLTKHFHFLDKLRESGVTNMFGARPMLAEAFGLDEKLSKTVHQAWMQHFDGETTAEERAAKAHPDL